MDQYIERFHQRVQHLCKFNGPKKVITQGKISTSTRLLLDTNMAAVSLFWKTIMAAVTCENSRYLIAETLSENGKKSPYVDKLV